MPEVTRTKHAMLDLETLGTTSKAVIAECAAVLFDPYGEMLSDEPVSANVFYRPVDLQACLRLGMEVTGGTILFWLSQPEGARQRLLQAENDHKTVMPHTLLTELTTWIMAKDVRYVWSRGITFDIGILNSYYEKLNRETPWSFRDVRDSRTIISMSELTEEDLKNIGVNPNKHNPVYDAWYEARAVQYCMKEPE